MSVESQITAIAQGLGASQMELTTLLGIAYAESKFDPDASGDNGYSNGAFQAERQPGVPLDQQVKNALTRIRQQTNYLSRIYSDLAPFIDNSDGMVARYNRAAWQTSPQMPQNWLAMVSQQVDVIRQQYAAAGTTIDDAGVLQQLNNGQKLTVDDMINWAGTRDVNANALRSGQEQFLAYFGGSIGTPTMTAGLSVFPLLVLGGLALWWWWKR